MGANLQEIASADEFKDWRQGGVCQSQFLQGIHEQAIGALLHRPSVDSLATIVGHSCQSTLRLNCDEI